MTIADGARSARHVGTRTGRPNGSRSPAQIASLVIGVWWTINGIGALLIDPNFATSHVHGTGDVFGLVAITVNGWHALFHLLPGLLAIAVASRPRGALACMLGIGAVYVVVGCWGLLAGGGSLGVLAVDAPGSGVHLFEGVVALAAGIWTLRTRGSDSSVRRSS